MRERLAAEPLQLASSLVGQAGTQARGRRRIGKQRIVDGEHRQVSPEVIGNGRCIRQRRS
jgi:hypothetical protein